VAPVTKHPPFAMVAWPAVQDPRAVVQPRFDLPLPHFAAGVRVIANHRLHRTALLLREKEVPRDREGRPRPGQLGFFHNVEAAARTS